jgi:hypothetical protein
MNIANLTDNQIGNIPHTKVFEFVRDKVWTRVEFDKWVEESRVMVFAEALQEFDEEKVEND